MTVEHAIQLVTSSIMGFVIGANIYLIWKNRRIGLVVEQNLSATRSNLAAARTLEAEMFKLKKRTEYRLIIATDGIRHALFLAEGGHTDIVISSLNKTLKLMGECDGKAAVEPVRQDPGQAGQASSLVREGT